MERPASPPREARASGIVPTAIHSPLLRAAGSWDYRLFICHSGDRRYSPRAGSRAWAPALFVSSGLVLENCSSQERPATLYAPLVVADRGSHPYENITTVELRCVPGFAGNRHYPPSWVEAAKLP